MDAMTRRRFLIASGVTAGAALAAGATGVSAAELMARARTDPRPAGTGVLVLVTLYGGNDGLGTVVPYADPAYHATRPDLAYAPEQVLHLDQEVGLNPAMTGLKRHWDAGRLAVVRGVGYPQPDHSHFRSMAIWQSASPQASVPTGWLGRWLDLQPHDPVRAVSLGPVLLPALAGTTTAGATLPVGPLRLPGSGVTDALDRFANGYPGEPPLLVAAARSGTDLLDVARILGPTLDRLPARPATARPATARPATARNALAAQLDVVLGCLRARVPTRVYAVSLGGFDTHSDERGTQSALLGEVDAALAGFADSLASLPDGRDVVTVMYSEFGRRVAANASAGTDHGTAGPVFVLGPGVAGGFVGAQPSLTDLDAGDLKHDVDFRSVYATVLRDVLGTDPERVLGSAFDHLPLLRGA
jgi:uncharacterized protein (DUF1501 family)